MDHDYGSMYGGSWVLMVLMMLVVWGLLVVLILWLVRGARGSDEAPASRRVGSRAADDVLAQRYARGEIDDDEFERRRAALERAAAGL